MARERTPDEIRENDIVHFIVTVRKLATQSTDSAKAIRKIKNLANTMFRHYIGYTLRGEYRLKAKGERCFQDAVEQSGMEAPFAKLAVPNPRLQTIRASVDTSVEVATGETLDALSGVEFVDVGVTAVSGPTRCDEGTASAGGDTREEDDGRLDCDDGPADEGNDRSGGENGPAGYGS